MLRDRDYLLTLAAVWLLVAALNSKSRPNFVITASAAGDGHSFFEQSSPAMQVDVIMSKIKQNLEQPKRQLSKPAETKRVEPQTQASPLTNFSHYEDHNERHHNQQAQRPHPRPSGPDSRAAQFKEAKEVRVDRLRSGRKSPAQSNATNSVFLLNQNSSPTQQLASNHIDGDILTGSEQQQQQQPFLFPPGSNSPDIRQILQNYQRYPQLAGQLTDQQRQILTQLQPRPAQLHLRPPTSPAPAPGLSNGLGGPQQPQQMLSPLQLLAGPLQAFLPALAANQQQQSNQLSGDNRRPASGSTPAPNSAVSSGQQQQQQQQPLGGLLNALNLAPNRAHQQQQTSPGPNGLANLQDFYQQLPLYQALLAARQRQEALQAAERVRQQQQQQQQGAGLGPFNLMPLLPPPPRQSPAPNSIGSGGNALPLPPAPPFATGPLPPANAFGPVQPQMPPPSNGNQNLWPPASNPASAAGHQPGPRPQTPTSNQEGPVQFDDDDGGGGGERANNNDDGGGQQQDQNKNDKHDNGNQQPAHDSGTVDNTNSNNNNNNDDAGDQNQVDPGPQQPQNNNQAADQNEAKVQDALDPELKEFQKLAEGGGDSWADMIPPGLMSNNDINEINREEAEQKKKQEAEERQRHQQQQQQQQHQQQPQQDQQLNNQSESGDNNGGQIDNGNQNNETDQPQDNEDQEDDGDGGGGGGGGEQAQDQPTSAALTAKSSSASETTKRRAKLAESPGVEYAK